MSVKLYGLLGISDSLFHVTVNFFDRFHLFCVWRGVRPWTLFYWMFLCFFYFLRFFSSLVETQSSTKNPEFAIWIPIQWMTCEQDRSTTYSSFFPTCALTCGAVVSVNSFDFIVSFDCLTCSRLNFGAGTSAWTLQGLCALSNSLRKSYWSSLQYIW